MASESKITMAMPAALSLPATKAERKQSIFRADPVVKQRLRIYSAAKRESQSDIINKAVAEYMQRHPVGLTVSL